MLITRGKILSVETEKTTVTAFENSTDILKISGDNSKEYKITSNKAASGTKDMESSTCTVQIPLFANTTLVANKNNKNTNANDAVFKNVPMVTSPGVNSTYAVGSTVLVAFENNLLNNPIVIGQLYIPSNTSYAEKASCENLTATESIITPEIQIKESDATAATTTINNSGIKTDAITVENLKATNITDSKKITADAITANNSVNVGTFNVTKSNKTTAATLPMNTTYKLDKSIQFNDYHYFYSFTPANECQYQNGGQADPAAKMVLKFRY